MSTRERQKMEWWAGVICFIAFIAADFIFGVRAAVKVAGVSCVFTGAYWLIRRSVPVGFEGRSPTSYLSGWTAVFAGLVMIGLGIALLVRTEMAVCVLGWGASGGC